jgi:hypothetical protein
MNGQPDWPTPETASLWQTFVGGLAVSSTAKWTIQKWSANVTWHGEPAPEGTSVRLFFDHSQRNMRVLSHDLDPLGFLPYRWEAEPVGVALGEVAESQSSIAIIYIGPSDFFSSE